jgi:Protein of unknown function (DUF2778)
VRGHLPNTALYSMAAGIAALASAFVVLSEMPAPSSDSRSHSARIAAAFGTIHSDTQPYRTAAAPQMAPVRLASLEADVSLTTFAADEAQMAPAPTIDGASFGDRFNSSFGDASSSFHQRFETESPTVMVHAVQRPDDVAAAEPGPVANVPMPPEAPHRQNGQLAALALAPTGGATLVTRDSASNKPVRLASARSDSMLPAPGSDRTAVYDITARVVYLPNGDRLEAHSGLGVHMDDPGTVTFKNKGVTPPNVYELSLREQLFHGTRAIRLTPADPDKMFGRDGILAHSYLLGPSGESNGCVSIKDYTKFLNAYLNGEIERLVVVERLPDAPANTAATWLAERIKAFFKSS